MGILTYRQYKIRSRIRGNRKLCRLLALSPLHNQCFFDHQILIEAFLNFIVCEWDCSGVVLFVYKEKNCILTKAKAQNVVHYKRHSKALGQVSLRVIRQGIKFLTSAKNMVRAA